MSACIYIDTTEYESLILYNHSLDTPASIQLDEKLVHIEPQTSVTVELKEDISTPCPIVFVDGEISIRHVERKANSENCIVLKTKKAVKDRRYMHQMTEALFLVWVSMFGAGAVYLMFDLFIPININ